MRRLGLSKMRERSVNQGSDSGPLSLSSLGVCFDAVESLTVTDDDFSCLLKNAWKENNPIHVQKRGSSS